MVETDEGSKCFWIENQYLQNRQSSESNTSHISYNLQRNLQHSLNPIQIEWGKLRVMTFNLI